MFMNPVIKPSTINILCGGYSHSNKKSSYNQAPPPPKAEKTSFWEKVKKVARVIKENIGIVVSAVVAVTAAVNAYCRFKEVSPKRRHKATPKGRV